MNVGIPLCIGAPHMYRGTLIYKGILIYRNIYIYIEVPACISMYVCRDIVTRNSDITKMYIYIYVHIFPFIYHLTKLARLEVISDSCVVSCPFLSCVPRVEWLVVYVKSNDIVASGVQYFSVVINDVKHQLLFVTHLVTCSSCPIDLACLISTSSTPL